MADCMLKLLSKKGILIIEVQYLLRTLQDVTFDNIYHEHYNYWSLTSLTNFFKKFDASIFKAEEINTHGGSLRIYISKRNSKKIDKSVSQLLKKEENEGLKKFATYKTFGEKIYNIRRSTKINLKKIKNKYKDIIAYGAPAKATTLLNFFGISEEINYVIEDNQLKHNKFIPGTDLQIKDKNILNKYNDSAVFGSSMELF